MAKKVAIIVTNEFEDVELTSPKEAIEEAESEEEEKEEKEQMKIHPTKLTSSKNVVSLLLCAYQQYIMLTI